jgi:hypothetical protein
MPPDFAITMLDGNLGAVTEPDNPLIVPSYEGDCWCGCVVCVVGPAFDGE